MKKIVALTLIALAFAGAVSAQKLEMYYYKQENQEWHSS
jgi:hypothetical protein